MDTSPSELIFLDGTVSAVIYRNEENAYHPAPRNHRRGEEVTVVAPCPGINPGEGLRPRPVDPPQHHGEQFKAEIVERRMPVGRRLCWNTWPPGPSRASAPPPPGGCWTSLGRISSPSSRRTPAADQGAGHLPQAGGDHPPIPLPAAFMHAVCWTSSPPTACPCPSPRPCTGGMGIWP